MRKHAFYFTADTDMGLVVELLSDTPFVSKPRKVEFDENTGVRLAGKISLYGTTSEYEYCFVLDSKTVIRDGIVSLFRNEPDIKFVFDMFDEN